MAVFRSSNPFRHESERLVAQRLAERLTAPGFVIGNYLLPGRYSGGEIDLVAVLPTSIVAIEVKHWFGRIVRMGASVEFENGYSAPNPFPGLLYKSKFLRSLLVEQKLIDARVPVGSCLVHGPGKLRWPDDVLRNQYVCDIEQAPAQIASGAMLPRGRRNADLSRRELGAIADALAEGTSGADAWRVGHFIIDQELPATAFARQFSGRCTHVRERDVLLRCWEIQPLADEATRVRTLRRFETDAAALARLETKRCRAIPIVYDAFPDPSNFDVFWTAQEFNGTVTLGQERHRFMTERSFRESILGQLDEGLEALRDSGIVHRNLGAEVITISDDGRILIGGLEYSANEDSSTCRRTVAHARRVSPEVVAGAGETTASDLYAAGLMILDLLLPSSDQNEKRLSKIRDRSLRAALSELLDHNPKNRAADLAAVRAALLEWNA